MKIRSRSLALGILLGITAIIAMGIVYIDNVNNYWKLGGAGNAYVQFYVSNNFVMGVNTNTGRIGIGSSNANTLYLDIVGATPGTNATGNGTTANVSGRIGITGGIGGSTFDPTSASGGAGGQVVITGGRGGSAPLATTNATSGNGGNVSFVAGAAGLVSSGVATNSTTGGNGGSVTMTAAAGGAPNVASTNTVGGDGGSYALSAGSGGAPAAGWARKGGLGGSFTLTAGNGGSGVRTNGGNGGSMTYTAGDAGSTTTSGNPGQAGDLNFNAGNGGTGDTNSNGGNVYIRAGNPGGSANPGKVYLARNSSGSARGGIVVGLGETTITNIIGASASLDFPSTAAGTFSDLAITVTGATSNNMAIALSVPWMCATNGGGYVTYSSNDAVYVRLLNNQPAAAIDPPAGTFTVVGFRIQ